MILFSTQPPRTASRSLPIPVVGIRAEDDAARLLDRVCTKALKTSRDGGAQPGPLPLGSGLFTDADTVVTEPH